MQELQAEQSKPKPSEPKIESLKRDIELTQARKQKGDIGREGIVFPPNEEEKIIIPITPPEELIEEIQQEEVIKSENPIPPEEKVEG